MSSWQEMRGGFDGLFRKPSIETPAPKPAPKIVPSAATPSVARETSPGKPIAPAPKRRPRHGAVNPPAATPDEQVKHAAETPSPVQRVIIPVAFDAEEKTDKVSDIPPNPETGTPASAASDTPAEYSDDSLARKFTELHGDNLRYTAAWLRWNIFDGRVWKEDDTLKANHLARAVCREVSEGCANKRIGARIASAMTISNVERLARSDRRHAATVDQWDSNPWLLNTPSGVVDLETGELRDANRDDYMTKLTSVAPSDGGCPLWIKTLSRITGGDEDLQSYLQRMIGYSLTGVTVEHAMFFLYGLGANGKSVFLNTVSGMLGDYAKSASVETFIDSKNEHHPTDLAGLQGARLITAVETENGRRWAESKLKALTGGDRIAARFMRQDFFEFTPQFKLLVSGNHKPGLRNVDEAIRRRFNLVPFTVTIPAPERDLELGEKLRAEWGGILRWAIQGCLEWQSTGLRPPKAVCDATENYFAAEDSFATWLDDRTERRDGAWESATLLFVDWKTWAESSGEYVGSQKRFSENLATRGFGPMRTKAARGFSGIRLRANAVSDVDGSTAAHTPKNLSNGNDSREVEEL